jgi:ABC-type anion transport system duplicated permease subunit
MKKPVFAPDGRSALVFISSELNFHWLNVLSNTSKIRLASLCIFCRVVFVRPEILLARIAVPIGYLMEIGNVALDFDGRRVGHVGLLWVR